MKKLLYESCSLKTLAKLAVNVGNNNFFTIPISKQEKVINFYKTNQISKFDFICIRILSRLHLLIISKIKELSNQSPIIILSSERTGSSYLQSVIKSCHKTFCCFEILNFNMAISYNQRAKKRKILLYLKRLKYINKSDRLIFKIHHSHLYYRKLSIEDLKEIYPNAQFIILYRENILEQYVSLLTAKKMGIWQTSVDQNNLPSISINIEEFRKFSKKQKETHRTLRNLYLNNTEFTFISYESMMERGEVTTSLLKNFLHLKYGTIKVYTKKINTQKMSDRIINYNEVLREVSAAELYLDTK